MFTILLSLGCLVIGFIGGVLFWRKNSASSKVVLAKELVEKAKDIAK